MGLPERLEEIASLLESAHRKSSKSKSASVEGGVDPKTLLRMNIYSLAKEASYTEAYIEAARRGAL